MPLLQVTAPENTLNKEQQDRLMSRLSDAILTAETAPVSDPGARSLMWAYYSEQAKENIYIGGEPQEKPPFRISITTPKGALNDASRESLVAEIGQIVDDIVGPYEGRLNQWTMLTDLQEGGWAGSGQIFRLADIQAAMNIKTF